MVGGPTPRARRHGDPYSVLRRHDAFSDEVASARNHLNPIQIPERTDEGLDGFVLRGRADRIDLLKDGRLALIDYKTGLQPSAKSVADLESPQLPLEAAMARHGAFGPDLAREAAWLGYVRLRPTDTLKVDRIGTDESRTAKASALSTQVWKNLADMISAYRDPNKDYRSKARPAAKKQWEGDFDHLARVLSSYPKDVADLLQGHGRCAFAH